MADTLLNKVPFTIRLRRMLASALVKVSSGYQYEGEPGYATDTEQLYMSNGTLFKPVQTANLLVSHDDELVFSDGDAVIHY
jgi:hypothetical protein